MKVPVKSFALVVAANTYDAAMTAYFIGNNLAVEVNPLMAWLMNQLGLIPALTVGKGVGLTAALIIITATRDEPVTRYSVPSRKVISYTLIGTALLTFSAGSYGVIQLML